MMRIIQDISKKYGPDNPGHSAMRGDGNLHSDNIDRQKGITEEIESRVEVALDGGLFGKGPLHFEGTLKR